MAKVTFSTKPSLLFIERMITALKATPMTRQEMQETLFASRSKVVNYIRHLHGDDNGVKRIFIESYNVPDGKGGRVPRYAVGDSPDASTPGKETEAERWARIKANPALHAREKELKRRYARNKGIPPAKRVKNNKLWAAALLTGI